MLMKLIKTNENISLKGAFGMSAIPFSMRLVYYFCVIYIYILLEDMNAMKPFIL